MKNSRKIAGAIRSPIAAILLALPLMIAPASIAPITAQTSAQTTVQTTANGTLYITGPPQPCLFLSEPQLFNSRDNNGTIVIGQQQGLRHQVLIPGNDATALAHIRTCIVDAFATQIRREPYIQVGSFETRNEAEAISHTLQQEGYSARVIYRR